MKQKKLITCLFFLFVAQHVFLQKLHVMASAGTHLSEGKVKLSFTLGETFTSPLTMGENKITQGFQQPHQHPFVSANEPTKPTLKIYPNPTCDFVMVEVQEMSTDFSIRLYNASGQMLQSYIINSPCQKIDLSTFPAGFYLLQTDHQNQQNAYTIIKSSTF